MVKEQANWSPYDNNGGTVVAIAGADYCVIASDTRMSTGYSILTRDYSKICKLADKSVMASSGFQADVRALQKVLAARHLGGFEQDAVATANILETATPVVGGKQYYSLSVLTRTADGDEGGKHQLITATVKDGKLYICKAQAGDKRWFKGAKKFVESATSSFSVA